MDLGIGNNMINNIMILKDISATGNAAESASRKAAGSSNEDELKKACMEFESIFLQMMYKYMKNTVPKSNLISKGMAEEFSSRCLTKIDGGGFPVRRLVLPLCYTSSLNDTLLSFPILFLCIEP